VKEGREEEKPTWGTTIAGVSTKHLHAFCTLKCLVMSIIIDMRSTRVVMHFVFSMYVASWN
jgi:hypothetical protein